MRKNVPQSGVAAAASPTSPRGKHGVLGPSDLPRPEMRESGLGWHAGGVAKTGNAEIRAWPRAKTHAIAAGLPGDEQQTHLHRPPGRIAVRDPAVLHYIV
jgi:hypothetical protein